MMHDYHSASCDGGNAGTQKASFSDRRFNDSAYFDGRVETLRDGQPWTFVSCAEDDCSGLRAAHNDAIVVAVDGACRGNGRFGAQAAYGVYFHDGNDEFNTAELLPDDEVHTNQRAELHAGLRALELTKFIRADNPPAHRTFLGKKRFGPRQRLKHVVIKSDSVYLVNGMTTWIDKWRDNGFLNARGVSVTNEDLFQELDEAIFELNSAGVQVDFWHVRREQNGKADCLANAALDGLTNGQAIANFLRYESSQDDFSYDY